MSDSPTVPSVTPAPGRHPARARIGLIQITAAAVLWGTSGVIAQLVHRSTGMGAMDISFWRLAVSAAAMLLIAVPGFRLVVRAARRDPWALTLAGVALAAYQGLYFLSVTTAGVNIATMVSLGTAPVVAALWEAFRRRRVPGLRPTAVIVVAVIGLVLVAGGHGSEAAGPNPTLGVLAALGSGVIYGGSAILGRHLAQHTPAVAMTTLTSVVGAAVLAPFAVFSGPYVVPADAPVSVGVAWAGIAAMGVLATALAYILFNRGLQATESSVAAVLTLIEPLTAAVLAVTVLSEPTGLTTVVGAALLLGSVAVLYLAPGPAGTVERTTAGGVPAGTAPAPPTAG
ncbi:DMT family transporter [Nakamurella deserti]|uniref:DMT family transporter n=1 Tax=Nakamurella deserti TaxID=2164074 RepID=UPI00130016D4|nr:EamA family transporter [Nakamurella deserti]